MVSNTVVFFLAIITLLLVALTVGCFLLVYRVKRLFAALTDHGITQLLAANQLQPAGFFSPDKHLNLARRLLYRMQESITPDPDIRSELRVTDFDRAKCKALLHLEFARFHGATNQEVGEILGRLCDFLRSQPNIDYEPDDSRIGDLQEYIDYTSGMS